jgi:hypothetical protein
MITVKKLAAGIEKRLGHSPEESLEEARVVMNYFGFTDTIIDNRVEPEDRKLFYALQEVGILHSSWETVPLLDGRHWRIFYWQLDEKTLDRLARDEETPSEEHVYQTLPDEAWSHPPAAM